MEGTADREDPETNFMEGKVVSSSQSSELIRGVSREEVKAVLFSMDSRKAPGPDGFNAHFYKKAWSIVGEEFTDAVLHFFNTDRLLKELNNTSLTLILKVANPSRNMTFCSGYKTVIKRFENCHK